MEGEAPNGNRAARWLRDWLPLIGMLIAGLVWGMKLEGSVASNTDAIRQLSTEVAENRGVLVTIGRSEERIANLAERLRIMEVTCVKRTDVN